MNITFLDIARHGKLEAWDTYASPFSTVGANWPRWWERHMASLDFWALAAR